MFRVSPTHIVTMNRGDSGVIKIFLNRCNILTDVPLELSPTDCIYVGVMENNSTFETAIVRKKYLGSDVIDGVLSVIFRPEDTLNLLPGLYYYEVKLVTTVDNIEHVQTIIPRRIFNIIE